MSSPRARATAAADVPGGRRELHTFRGNLKSTRHGWLRLTPAYSVRLVDGLLEDGCAGPVLDPFCGTGTTLLSCSEHGIDGDSVDINPFLVWLARSKVARYSTAHVEEARRGAGGGVQRMSTAAIPVAFADSIYFFSYRGSTGGTCGGDSGAGGVATNLAAYDINIGPHSSSEHLAGQACTKPNGEMYRPQVGRYWSFIEDVIGRSCTRYQGTGFFFYKRCW